MRGLVIFLLIVVFIASFSFVAANLDSLNIGKNKNKEVQVREETKAFEFSTFTSAVCENKEDLVHCRDEFFVNCNGKIAKAVDFAECNGIKVEVPKVLGFAVFSKDWKDPRG